MSQQRFKVIGIDASEAMLDIARARFPDGDWRLMDMRVLDLPEKFHGIIGWNSFFHLTQQEQCAVLPILASLLEPGGVLMLTVGHHEGEKIGNVGDEPIYHASLSPQNYEFELNKIDMNILSFVVEDPKCDFQTVLITQKQ